MNNVHAEVDPLVVYDFERESAAQYWWLSVINWSRAIVLGPLPSRIWWINKQGNLMKAWRMEYC